MGFDNEVLPIHSKLRIKRLSNGLSVYLLPAPLPAESCELRLIVRVGSMNEGDDECGFAHFIEHLGFKGTKSFKSYELVKALESLGIVYGPDMNASTGLFETKYRLTNLSVDQSLSQVQLGLKILYEWAFEMSISESDVEEEKQVIFAEYRMKQGLSQRLLSKYWSSVFGVNSKINKRMPIGTPEIFMSLQASNLQKFYKNWYKPENMCIVCCGDIELCLDKIESLIYSQFGPDLTKAQNLNYNEVVQNGCQYFPKTENDVIIALNDSEVTMPQISLEICWPNPSDRLKITYADNLRLKVLSSILNYRFSKIVKGYDIKNPFLAKSSESLFIGAGVSVRNLVQGIACYGITLQFSNIDDNLFNILCAIFYEFLRLEKFGILELELRKAVNKWANRFKDMDMNSKRENSSSLASDAEEYFLLNEKSSILSSDIESKIAQGLLNNLTVEDINNSLQFLDIHRPFNSSIHKDLVRIISVQSKSNDLTDMSISEFVESARCKMKVLLDNGEITPWLNESALESDEIISAAKSTLGIISSDKNISTSDDPCTCCMTAGFCNTCIDTSIPLTVPSPRVSELPKNVQYIKAIDTHHVTLDNGINVCLKYMPESSANKISIQGFALQGISELSPEEACAFALLDDVASLSGFVTPTDKTVFSGVSIQDLQMQTNTSLSTQRHYHHRGIGGSCPSQHIELLLALLVLRLSSAQIFNEEILEQQKLAFVNSVTRELSSPYFAFLDKARVLTCGDNPFFRPCTVEMIQSITLEQIKQIYFDAFVSNPLKFTFVFVGDLPEIETMTELLNTYIGRFKLSENIKESRFSTKDVPYTVIKVEPSQSNVKESLFYDIEFDKSSSIISFVAQMPHENDEEDITATFKLDATCKLIQARLLDNLRMKLGKVYYVSVERSRNSLSPISLISIGFHCGADDVDLLQALILSELHSIQNYGIDEVSLQPIKESMLKSHKLSLTVPSYWLFWILDSYKAFSVLQSTSENACEDVVQYLEAAVYRRAYDRVDIINNLNSATVKSIVEEYVQADKAVIVDLRPHQSGSDAHGVE